MIPGICDYSCHVGLEPPHKALLFIPKDPADTHRCPLWESYIAATSPNFSGANISSCFQQSFLLLGNPLLSFSLEFVRDNEEWILAEAGSGEAESWADSISNARNLGFHLLRVSLLRVVPPRSFVDGVCKGPMSAGFQVWTYSPSIGPATMTPNWHFQTFPRAHVRLIIRKK